MEAALVSRLAGTPAVAALTADRIAWFEFPRGTTGARVLLTLISPGREYTHQGADGLDGPSVQFDALAADPDTALALANALRTLIEGPAQTVSGVRFHPGQQQGGFADSEVLPGAEPIFRVSRDYLFYHEETSP